MTVREIIEVGLAALLIVGGAWLYRRSGKADPNHGSQGAVILIVIGVIMAIHGFGLLEYRSAGSMQ